MERERAEARDDPFHHGLRFPVRILQEERETADPFDPGGHIGWAQFLAELDEISLPVTKLFAAIHGLWVVLDRQFISKSMSLGTPLSTTRLRRRYSSRWRQRSMAWPSLE